MDIIKSLQSKDFVKLNDFFKGKIREKLNKRIESKMDAYKASLLAHNAALKATAK